MHEQERSASHSAASTSGRRHWDVHYSLEGADSFSICVRARGKRRQTNHSPKELTPLPAPSCIPQPTAFAPAHSVPLMDHQAIAIEQLRAQLSSHLEELDVMLAAGEDLSDATLYRWLRARGWNNIDHDAQCILQHAQWRRKLGERGRVQPEQIEAELAAKKVFLQPHADAQGHSVLTVLARRHDMHVRDLSQTALLIAYALDSATDACNLTLNPLGQIVCLFDLSKLSVRNLDVSGLRSIFETLQQHYPERLAALWFINAPFLFWGVWNLVKGFVDPATRAKLHFVSVRPSAGIPKELSIAFPAHVLPKDFGGTAELLPLQEAVKLRERARAELEVAQEAAAHRAAEEHGSHSRWAVVRRGVSQAGNTVAAPVRSLGNVLRRIHIPGPPSGVHMGSLRAPLRQFSSMFQKPLSPRPMLRAASCRALQVVKGSFHEGLLYPVAALFKSPSPWHAVIRVLDLARRVLRWTLGPL